MNNPLISGKFNLPSEWKVDILDNFTNLIVDGTHFTPNYTENGIPFLRVTDIQENKIDFTNLKFITIEEHNSLVKRCKPEKGDILYSKNGTIGIPKIVDWDWEFSIFVSLCLIKPQKHKLNSYFLKFILQSELVKWQIHRRAKQGTVTNLHLEEIRELEIPKIKLPHQRKIARILTTVDNIIEKTESAVGKYKAIKQGMMHDLFTRGIDVKTGKLRPSYEDAPELYEETELGMIPKEWEVKMLEEFVYMKSGDGITSESIEVMGDYPVYGGNGLRGYAKKYTHSGGFVLIGRQGALCGNVFRVRGKFFASEHAVVVTILDSSNVDWLAQKLKFMKLNKYSEASAQPGLAVTKLLSLSVALPKENEQKEVSKRLLILNSKLKIEQTALSKYQKLKQALMQDLLTGKKEVIPDPEDFDRE